MNIEDTIEKIESLINRKLEKVECLIVGIAYQEGLLRNIKQKDDE
jgi:hypothetical protein